MTLREELEILRGEPIRVFTGDPLTIPCIETSDTEKLCKNPVVSVHMITYNHEPYIRQAIEGVMMQKTDFEFELIIGEDASTDRTREICFEYQKKYPDKIRVLWWHENLRKVNHPSGKNGARNMAHCRGEFIAFCEGDDYWIDPLKLQKQVNVLRNHPSIGLCFAGCDYFNQTNGTHYPWNKSNAYPIGRISSKTFQLWHLFGKDPTREPGDEGFIMTPTAIVRRANVERASRELEIYRWSLALGDSQVWIGATMYGDAYFLPDTVAVYRQLPSGACQSGNGKVWRDAYLIRFYYYITLYGGSLARIPDLMRDRYTWIIVAMLSKKSISQSTVAYWNNIRRSVSILSFYSGFRRLIFRFCFQHGFEGKFAHKCIVKWLEVFGRKKHVPHHVKVLINF